MVDTHGKIIAVAARSHLQPLGFRRQGRSRLWLADGGYWLNVVEFTPSRWSKSVSLTNAAHWLWTEAGFLAFNVCDRSANYADYESDDQFKVAMSNIAEAARATAIELQQRFSTLEAITRFVVERAITSPDRMAPSWWGYEAGIVSGLVNRFDDAERFLRSVTDHRVSARAQALLPLLGDHYAFKGRIAEMVAQQRGHLKLAPSHDPHF